MIKINNQNELNKYYDILFNFNSDVWKETNYSQKKALLEDIFSITPGHIMNLRLFLLKYETQSFDFIIPKGSIDSKDYIRPIVRQIDLWDKYFFVGLYLNKSILPDFNFPLLKSEIEDLRNNLEQIKSRRKAKYKKIQKEAFKNNIITRELFDFSISQGESSSLIEKREKLINLAKIGIQPIELLFYHHIIYFEQDTSMNPGDSVYDAFDLCWYNGKIL